MSYEFSVPSTNQTSRLRPHPLNAEIYGDSTPDAALVKSIQQHGILNPIVINAQKEILSGTRRWLAAKELGLKSVPVITLANETWRKDRTLSDRDILRSQLFLVESNKARIKTESQKDAEAAALLRIETELAAARQRAGVRQNLAEGGKAVEKVAAITGESPETVRKRVEIHEAKIPTEKRDKQSTHAAFNSQEVQNNKRRRGFIRKYPEYRGKTTAEIDAAIREKYGDAPAQLKKSQVSPSGASVSSTVENPSTSSGSNPTASLQNSNDVIDGVEVPRHKNGNRCSDCVITMRNQRGFCHKHKYAVPPADAAPTQPEDDFADLFSPTEPAQPEVITESFYVAREVSGGYATGTSTNFNRRKAEKLLDAHRFDKPLLRDCVPRQWFRVEATFRLIPVSDRLGQLLVPQAKTKEACKTLAREQRRRR